MVSLVPSLTELIWTIDPGALVGRTRYCNEPAGVLLAPAAGGTKDPDLGMIAEIAPDLVIANREENRREDVEALRLAGIEVLVTDPASVEQAMQMVVDIAARLGNEEAGWDICGKTAEILREPVRGEPIEVFVAVWPEPLIGLGGQTFGNDVLKHCGLRNILEGRERYPGVERGELAALGPRLILLPDEPYRFGEQHVAEFADIAPARVIDGKLLWWYGPRMAASIRRLREIVMEERR